MNCQRKSLSESGCAQAAGRGRPYGVQHTLGRERLLAKLGAEWLQRIVGADPDDADGANCAGLADAFGAELRRALGRLDMFDMDIGHLRRHRDQIVRQRPVGQITGTVVDAFFVERSADALNDAAAHLLVDDQRIDDAAAIVDRPKPQ